MRIISVFLAAGLLLAEGPATRTESIKPIDSGHMERMISNQREAYLLQKEAYIIGLEVCAEAQINYKECSLDWKAGTVSKVVPAQAPTATPPAKPAK